MSTNKHDCPCGGTCEKTVDEVTGQTGDCICGDCGNPLPLCLSCGQPAKAWAIKDLCEPCARAYARGDVIINLNETQLCNLSNWASANNLLP